MATIDPITGLQNATIVSKKSPSADLNQVDFMQLIIAQMRNQNPLEPQSNADFMAQMAQFESLNQTRAMASGLKVLQGISELTTAAQLLGKTVTAKQVNAIGVMRDQVGRDLFGQPFEKLSSAQRMTVNNDPRVVAAAADSVNAGREVSGVVERVVVGPDGVPMLLIGDRVVDLFTVAEVR